MRYLPMVMGEIEGEAEDVSYVGIIKKCTEGFGAVPECTIPQTAQKREIGCPKRRSAHLIHPSSRQSG